MDAEESVFAPGVLSDNAFRVTSNGAITEIIDDSSDGMGNALDGPMGVALDGEGNAFVMASAVSAVFKISGVAAVTSIFSDGFESGSTGAWSLAVP